MATSLVRNQKRGHDRSYSNKYLSFGVKIAKIGPVDPEIICLHLKKKEINASKIYNELYNPVGNLAKRAKQALQVSQTTLLFDKYLLIKGEGDKWVGRYAENSGWHRSCHE